MSKIVIAAEPPKPIEISLGAVDYKVRPIKTSLGIEMSQRFQSIGEDPAKLKAGVESIVKTMFGKTDAPKIMKRLADPNDHLDYEHVIELMTALVGGATENPTT